MQELIKVTEENGEQRVSARELYEKLGIKERFSVWFERIVKTLNLLEQDYRRETYTSLNNQELQDFLISVDIGKHIAMVSGGENASNIRNYFILVEKAWNSPEKVMARALQIAQKEIENYKKEIEYQKPKVEFYDQIIDSKDTIDIGSLAKTLNIRNIGRNKLFEILRERKILDSKNQPYQTYIDRGYFRTIETSYIQGGDVKIHIKTVVFQKGVDYISKMLKTE